MIHIIARYRVKKGREEEAREIVGEFVAQVKVREKGTLLYQAFHEIDNERNFFHLMTFKDGFSQEVHSKSPHVKKLADQLYPLCEGEPEFVGLELIEGR